jgi:hypothetical protein
MWCDRAAAPAAEFSVAIERQATFVAGDDHVRMPAQCAIPGRQPR